MRTLILIATMLALALAAGLSFVVRAGAEPDGQSAALDFSCAPPGQAAPPLPSGVARLLSCTAVARDTGAAPLVDARLSFSATSGDSIPDEYYFFRYAVNGVERPLTDSQLTYDFGNITPGARSEIALAIIVRSSHSYGADVALQAGTPPEEYARVTVHNDVTDDLPAQVPVKLFRSRGGDCGGDARYELYVTSTDAAGFDNVTVELAPGSTAAVTAGDGWTPAAAGRIVLDAGPLAPGADLHRTLVYTLAPDSCEFMRPAVLVTATQRAKTLTTALIGESGSIGECAGQSGGGGGFSSLVLPDTGAGPGGIGDHAVRPASAALACGLLLMVGGVRLRRRSRAPV